jgi:hypothetical protein
VIPRPAYLDPETISPVDLKQAGARAYAEAATVLVLTYALADAPVQIWWPGEPLPADLLNAVASGYQIVTHNWQFDFSIWHTCLVPQGWPAIPPERWSCTAFKCRLARLPGKLEEAARILGLPPKDLTGKKLVLALQKRDLTTDPLTNEERDRVGSYCKQDTELARAIDRILPEIPEPWRPLIQLDLALNARGMPVDLDAVKKLVVVRDAETKRLAHQFQELTGNTIRTPRQNKKFKIKLAELGVPLPDLQRETLESWVEANPTRSDLAARLISTAVEWAHSADAKLNAMLASAGTTGRVRDGFILHGAHTGRFSSRACSCKICRSGR